MLHKAALKYILDIESIILELEHITEHHKHDYNNFSSNFISIRAVERDLMIIGEAVNKMTKLEPNITISNTKHIVGLRNMIVHAYDSIDPTLLWTILIKDIPMLKKEILDLKG
ncbi:DUF86 domain-containing protein [Flagellimonas amoyensis]|uniref:HepT-like ribonuclease domain-containing protein n=1 Tax=Flagellimonas amoyensis TaxID=2169401 RepID=UPI000D39D95F|nr:HepT-like ribonuclease domain-containing protein [Allomuricauda amoyensis]